MVQLMPMHRKTPSSLASSKSRLSLPFWCRLTQVVLEERPLNTCSSSSSYYCYYSCCCCNFVCQQSRTMIQQMMMLMRIETRLRQQAVSHYQQSQDAGADRAPGLDNVLALNSQLSEISSVLSTLIRMTSALGQRSGGQRRPAGRGGAQRLTQRRADVWGLLRSGSGGAMRRVSPRHWRDAGADSTPNDDDSGVTDDDDRDSADDDDYDSESTLDANGTAPTNPDIVDQLNSLTNELHQLTDGLHAGTDAVDSARSSPDGVTISPISDVHSLAGVDSASGFQFRQSISPVPSEWSLSSSGNVVSYSPSLSSCASFEGRPGTPSTPRFVVRVMPDPSCSPDGISISPMSDVQSLAGVDSALGLQSWQSISPVQSSGNVVSYSPSLSSCASFEGRPGTPRTPRFVVCVAPDAQCPCQVCSTFDHVSVSDDTDGDESVVHGCRHEAESLSASDAASAPGPRPAVILTPCEDGAVAGCPRSYGLPTQSLTYCCSTGTEPTATVHRPLQARGPGLPASQTSSLPSVGRESTQQSRLAVTSSQRQSLADISPPPLLPGPRQPPLRNYVARLRRQQMMAPPRLPSAVTITPWPPTLDSANQPPSPAASGAASGRVGPGSRGSVRPLLTANLPSSHPSSVVAAAARQSASSGRGRTTALTSRYNTSLTGDHSRLPRP